MPSSHFMAMPGRRDFLFGLGAGLDMPALHNPDYDFPDDIIPHGIDIFYQIFQLVQKDYN